MSSWDRGIMGYNYTMYGSEPPKDLIGDTDYIRGKDILTQFHNFSLGYPDYPFLNVDELMDYYGKVGHYLAVGLGLSAREMNLGAGDTEEIMLSLAEKSKGLVPEKWQDYNTVLINYAINPSILNSLKYTFVQTAKDLEKPLAAVGEGVVGVLKSGKYLPYILWGGLALYLWMNRNVLGRVIDKITK